jgi:hypothetical protein
MTPTMTPTSTQITATTTTTTTTTAPTTATQAPKIFVQVQSDNILPTTVLLAAIIPFCVICIFLNIVFVRFDRRYRVPRQSTLQRNPTHATSISPLVIQENPLRRMPQLEI